MMKEPERGIHRWVNTDDEIKLLILKAHCGSDHNF